MVKEDIAIGKKIAIGFAGSFYVCPLCSGSVCRVILPWNKAL